MAKAKKKSKITKKKSEVATAYESTTQEHEAESAFLERRSEKIPAPCLKVKSEEEGVITIGVDHSDSKRGSKLLMLALGTTDDSFYGSLLEDLAQITAKNDCVDEKALNGMIAIVKGIEPQNEVEAMLGAQMAAVHSATMTCAQRLAQAEHLDAREIHEKSFNKLARTFVAQMEGLKRFRTGGEQKVTVEHVTVNEGGQAIVGAISNGMDGGVVKKRKSTS